MLTPESRILVVDDFSTMRRIVKLTLKQIGYANVLEAESGLEAQASLAEAQFDLIICDWNMPGMTGLELLKWVRAQERLRETPFLMVTAEAKKENIIEAVQAGVTNYVVKPFNKQTLADRVQAIANQTA